VNLATLQALRAARQAGRPVVLATWLRADAEAAAGVADVPRSPEDLLAPRQPPAASDGHAAAAARDGDRATPAASDGHAAAAPLDGDRATPAASDGHAAAAPLDGDRATPAVAQRQRLFALSDPDLPADLVLPLARVLRSDAAEVVATSEGDVLLEPNNPPLRLILVGAVHIAHPLAEMARLAGFAVTLVDPRRSFATPERFPGQSLVVAWPDEALRGLAADARTAVVTLTHDPKLDDPALEVALTTPAFYVGCLGSKKTHASRLARLRDAGFDEPTLARLRGPVGLSIGARSPAEIAVSILAQIIAALRAPTP
jgi:xanthine dehydrogenase accessory factor